VRPPRQQGISFSEADARKGFIPLVCGEARMTNVRHLTTTELEAGLEDIRQSPKDEGTLRLIVRRPAIEKREVLPAGTLDAVEGLLGDTWKTRSSTRTTDGTAHPDMQLNLMNWRVIALLAPESERWPLAGDQLFLDLDLSEDNLPAGTRLALGSAVIEITTQPHNGCHKFAARFGSDALKFVNSPLGKRLHLRGVNARVVQAGTIRVGEVAKKLVHV